MKRFVLIMLSIFTCAIACSATETINWYANGQIYATTTCEIGGDIELPVSPYKKGYIFQGWENAIQYVEYIISDASHYIDTGVKDFYYPIIETKFQMLARGDIDWFGNAITNYNFNNEANIPYIRYGSDGSSTVYFIDGHSVKDLNFYSEAHTLKYGYNGIYVTVPMYVDGILIANIDTSNANFSNSNSSIKISGVRRPAYAKWYNFKIWNYDGTLLFDGRPAIDRFGNIGIYDTVGQNLHVGIGFTAGPVIDE